MKNFILILLTTINLYYTSQLRAQIFSDPINPVMNSTNNIGIGGLNASSPISKLDIRHESDYLDNEMTNHPFSIRNEHSYINLGVSNQALSPFSFIQSRHIGGNLNPLLLNPNGGNIGINISPDNSSFQFLNEKLTINGSIKFVQDKFTLADRKIEWFTADWGAGFGSKIYDANGFGYTHLRIASRNDAQNFTDELTFPSYGGMLIGNGEVPHTANIDWFTSNWGQGFGHRIYNADPGLRTELRIAARHNSTDFVDAIRINSKGTTEFMQPILFNNYNTAPYHPMIEFLEASGGSGYGHTIEGLDPVDGNGTELRISSRHNSSNLFATLTVTSNQKVFIGIKRPSGVHADYKLGVDGKLVAKHIIVQTSSWADKVFQPSYSLAPLREVESYINENHHLPEIPTEKEVLENGINLQDITVKLLQKVEELTLYSIQQNKKIEELEANMMAIKNKGGQ